MTGFVGDGRQMIRTLAGYFKVDVSVLAANL
jgi:hypothetical protein